MMSLYCPMTVVIAGYNELIYIILSVRIIIITYFFD